MSDFDSPLNEPPEIAHVAKVVSLDYPPPKEKRSRKQYRRETSIAYVGEGPYRAKIISRLSHTVMKKALELVNKTNGSPEDVKVFVFIGYTIPDTVVRRSIVVSSEESISDMLSDITDQCENGSVTENDVYCGGVPDYQRFLIQSGQYDHLKKSRVLPSKDDSSPGIFPSLGRSLILRQ